MRTGKKPSSSSGSNGSKRISLYRQADPYFIFTSHHVLGWIFCMIWRDFNWSLTSFSDDIDSIAQFNMYSWVLSPFAQQSFINLVRLFLSNFSVYQSLKQINAHLAGGYATRSTCTLHEQPLRKVWRRGVQMEGIILNNQQALCVLRSYWIKRPWSWKKAAE